MPKEIKSIKIRFLSGRRINGEYYGPKADKNHQEFTATTPQDIDMALQLIGVDRAVEVETKYK